MALQASGAISLNDVNVELGNSGSAAIDMNSSSVRGLFDVASGAITMADGYGKSDAPPIPTFIYLPNGTDKTQAVFYRSVSKRPNLKGLFGSTPGVGERNSDSSDKSALANAMSFTHSSGGVPFTAYYSSSFPWNQRTNDVNESATANQDNNGVGSYKTAMSVEFAVSVSTSSISGSTLNQSGTYSIYVPRRCMIYEGAHTASNQQTNVWNDQNIDHRYGNWGVNSSGDQRVQVRITKDIYSSDPHIKFIMKFPSAMTESQWYSAQPNSFGQFYNDYQGGTGGWTFSDFVAINYYFDANDPNKYWYVGRPSESSATLFDYWAT